MVHFNVPDMTCGGCAERIRRAIAQAPMLAGVEVAIDVAARQVRVPGQAEDDTVQLVRSAIARAGYKADAVVATSPHRTSGGCCCASRPTTSVDVNQDTASRTLSCCS
ncbi:copper chaperone [Acidovorax sp. 62]|jgi:copper chaperone|uniref:heavy-metal-associated domain-containing protein n=1 Tax=unclassified Acidovorax TaxID=2684926 RepID=UPI000C171103|nr:MULTISPECIES: heavy-metal-associated domain-containing protein [unclassified Acidovorax]PIF25963.1 copper chaperone [Acidovorax sp. 56]PIF90501.1 copper chaperone [Acidovorax sp. 62]TFI40143.1 copper chaperone [Diaphorobacter sp. DS2]